MCGTCKLMNNLSRLLPPASQGQMSSVVNWAQKVIGSEFGNRRSRSLVCAESENVKLVAVSGGKLILFDRHLHVCTALGKLKSLAVESCMLLTQLRLECLLVEFRRCA